MPISVFICHYDFDKTKNTCKWLLTTDETQASQTDQSYELASIDDLMHWAAATNQVFDNSIITVIEGKCKWTEYEYIDFCGKTEWKCGYEIIWD
jgi:hypothetical protein